MLWYLSSWLERNLHETLFIYDESRWNLWFVELILYTYTSIYAHTRYIYANRQTQTISILYRRIYNWLRPVHKSFTSVFNTPMNWCSLILALNRFKVYCLMYLCNFSQVDIFKLILLNSGHRIMHDANCVIFSFLFRFFSFLSTTTFFKHLFEIIHTLQIADI